MGIDKIKKTLRSINIEIFQSLLQMKGYSEESNEQEAYRLSSIVSNLSKLAEKLSKKTGSAEWEAYQEKLFDLFDHARNYFQQSSRDYMKQESEKEFFRKRPEMVKVYID